ncbi:MAG: low-specificity L-threonine aldolase [Deltaproteobacteria bacterium]|nr:low-specificity L-threonine aldolase [Deltaproteobacteria bacterium]MBW2412897.1 low-specificity L-threonine aldolase [Deltaproteobacteria bacterium]
MDATDPRDPIDLRSDTVTKPSPAMREAMAGAEVGDDVYGEDPTLNRLQERAAELVGKSAALFVPSGTMANQVAIRSWTRPGDAILVGKGAHVFMYESGGAAALSGAQPVVIGEDGLFDADDVREGIFPPDDHYARTRLVCVENTHNGSGGRVFPLERQLEIAAVAREAGLRVHLDGARLFNAAAATGRTVAELAAPCDSVSFCLSKGLGAPVGSLVCGDAEFVRRAHRYRKMFGGGMRQAGVLAAAGLFALEHNVKRLDDDHANARRFAEGMRQLPGVEGVREPETNIVLFRVPDLVGFVAGARARGVLINAIGPGVLRAVFHLDVHREDVDRALVVLGEVLQ